MVLANPDYGHNTLCSRLSCEPIEWRVKHATAYANHSSVLSYCHASLCTLILIDMYECLHPVLAVGLNRHTHTHINTHTYMPTKHTKHTTACQPFTCAAVLPLLLGAP